MLTCITCKQKIEDDGGEDCTRGTPEAVKSLTAQMKDIAVKVCGAYKCKSSIPTCRKGQRPNPDCDTLTSRFPSYHGQPGSSRSTPAWDFTNPNPPPEEWTAQVEPGIHITFVSLPHGGNDLKRIRFRREMFDKWQAQRWWGENYERIMELYNVEKFNQPPPSTPSQSEDGRDSCCSRLESSRESPTPGDGDERVEQDQPGVYITIKQLPDGTRELRRVRFSRDRFGEMHAKTWWEHNRDRIQAQYL